MKLASKMFTLTALAIACSAASAQQTASVAVTGNITPAACTASMSNDGAFKYADIDSTGLSNAGTGTVVSPAAPPATFNITCLGASQVAWSLTDNRSDSPYFTSDAGYMGLGKDKDGNKIGAYMLRMSNPVLDGTNVYVMYSTDGGTTWTYRERGGYVLRKSQLYSYSKTGSFNTLDKGSIFNGTMAITTTIAPKSTLNTTDVIDLDGSSTLNLSYL